MSEEQEEQENTETQTQTETVEPRLKKLYEEDIVPALMEHFKLGSTMAVPKLQKVVLNMGLGEKASDSGTFEEAKKAMRMIAGQEPIITRARKDIASFKIRKGQRIGCKVTLRGYRKWEFLDRLINVALPRIRDFQGVPRSSFDGGGNYSLGVDEQVVFPEVDMDQFENVFGMDITICTSAENDEQAYELLRRFGMPFREE